jgi:CRISPR type IV-associated DEAD/DEAH-box helicase Csf4
MPSLMIRIADAMRVEGYMPSNNEDLARAAKAKLAEILASPEAARLEDKPIPRASVHASVWVSAVETARLDGLSGATGMSPGETASALLLRDFDDWMQARKAPACPAAVTQDDALHRALSQRGSQPRQEQLAMLMAMRKLDVVDPPKVLFCEAGTGTGKTMAYLAYVIDHLKAHPAARAMVAAPSFGLLAQIGTELATFGDEAPEAVFLAGQNEWISKAALQDILSDRAYSLSAGQDSALRTWLVNGGDGSRPAWSMASLLTACPQFPFADDVTVAHRYDDEDPGWKAYEGQFARAANARLVVLTHAMLANLTKRRLFAQARALRADTEFQAKLQGTLDEWRRTNEAFRARYLKPEESQEGKSQRKQPFADDSGQIAAPDREQRFYEVMNPAMMEAQCEAGLDRLPDVDLLVIDEAHVIEDAFANAFGEYIAMRTLVKFGQQLHEEHNVFPQGALLDLLSFEKECRRKGREVGADESLDLDTTDILSRLSEAIDAALTPKKGASKAACAAALKSRPAQRLGAIKRICDLIAGGSGQQMAAYMHWSPMLDYPRLSLGKLRLDREMHYVWTVVAKRTALVSGTIYEEIPRPSCEGLRKALAVPFDATVTMSPIHARWQIDPVTLMMAADVSTAAGRRKLVRPPANLAEVERLPLRSAWLDDVCSYIAEAHSSATGGLLVLGTAFADVADLHNRLQSLGLQLVTQTPGVRMDGLRNEFLAASRQKGRPILLAVGAAWTGFDLHDPANPDALTDLIILNAPLGVFNRTVARLRRANQSKGHFEISAQALTLVRQAVGRLVRSPDTPHNRRIHWLDARIHDQKMKGIFAPITRFLARYKTVAVI